MRPTQTTNAKVIETEISALDTMLEEEENRGS
jgi:hypothetical protein